jgi:hypothetical protein
MVSIHVLPGVPNDARGDVPPGHGARVHASTLPPAADLAVWRELAAWLAAAEYLSGRGLPAALPAELVPVARRRGLCVWEVAA